MSRLSCRTTDRCGVLSLKVILETTALFWPVFVTESIRDPFMKTSGGTFFPVCFFLNQLFRSQGQTVSAGLHIVVCIFLLCVCFL